jgi:hypothetical protein
MINVARTDPIPESQSFREKPKSSSDPIHTIIGDPRLDKSHLAYPEDLEEIDFGRNIMSQGPLLVVFILLTIAAFYCSAKFPWSLYTVALPPLGFSVSIPYLFILPFTAFVMGATRLCDARYVIGPDYVRAVHGILSFRKHDLRIDFDSIRGIEVDRSIYGRIFNLGDIKIVSTMGDGSEILIDDVYDPSFYRDLIVSRKKILANKAAL